MKVYFLYRGLDTDGNEVNHVDSEFKLKMDIPASWQESPCERLLQFFVKTYNAKHTDHPLEVDGVEMRIGGVTLKSTAPVSSCVREYNDIVIAHKKVSKAADSHEGEILCTNYGCAKYFKEEENTETSCHCHTKAPVFHDLEKYWGCCPDAKAFDWEAFQRIPTCHVCSHATKNKPFSFAKEEIANVPLTQDQITAQNQQNNAPRYEERRTTGPREFEGAKQPNTPQEVIDGKAKCRNYGCGKEFVVADNDATACTYHSGGPVFHEGRKYWACCPTKKCDDFDDFVKVPGCSVGPHKL